MTWRAPGLGSPAAISTVVMVPFVILEFAENEPDGSWIEAWFLLAVIWMIAFVFVLVFRTLVRDFTFGGYVTAHPVRVAIRVLIVVALAVGFCLLALDQIGA